jgi:Gpi18-like mannosyltransferase
MSENTHPRPSGRSFFLLLTPLFAASLPSLVFCALVLAFWLHGIPAQGALTLHFSPEGRWDQLFALEVAIYEWIARWNSAVTLAATAFFVSTLLLPRWRPWVGLALIPYGLLLCADFTLRWR